MNKNLLLIIVFLLTSCADKSKEYDKAKAVSAFAIIDPIKVDPSLKKIAIKLPKQQGNNLWNGSNNEQNNRVENFSKSFLTKKNDQIILKKSDSIWSDLHFGYGDFLVFSPVIKDNKIFSLDTSGVLTARDLASKNKIWKTRVFAKRFLKNYQNPKISISDGKIFAVSGVNRIVAVNEFDGSVLWVKDISSVPISTPISDGKLVFVTTNDNKIYALNTESGELQWVTSGILRNTAILGAANPVFYKDFVIAAFSSGEIYAINKKTGDLVWSQDLNINKANSSDFYLNDIDATPLVKNDVIYSIGNGGLMMAINAKSGQYIWKREISGIADFWLAEDFLYTINNDSKLLAIYKKTGAIKWISELLDLKNKKPENKIVYNGVVMMGDKLVISSIGGNLIIASPFDGKIEKTFNVGKKIFHTPIIVDDKIYLHTLGRYMLDLVEIK